MADRSHPRRDVELRVLAGRADHVLGAAAADVDDEGLVRRPPGGRTEEGQPRLLLTGDGLRLDVEALTQQLRELGAVLGVADGAGRDGHDPIGAVTIDLLLVVLEDSDDALDRGVGEAAAGVHPLAEPRHVGAPLELLDVAVLDVRDEEPRGVGAKVDHGYGRHRSSSSLPPARTSAATTPSVAVRLSRGALRCARSAAPARPARPGRPPAAGAVGGAAPSGRSPPRPRPRARPGGAPRTPPRARERDRVPARRPCERARRAHRATAARRGNRRDRSRSRAPRAGRRGSCTWCRSASRRPAARPPGGRYPALTPPAPLLGF